MMTYIRFITFAFVLMLASTITFAGATPWNTLVVVNDGSIESQDLGNYYATARGIPARNICHLDFGEEYFRYMQLYIAKTAVLERVQAYIADNNLSNQIDAIVLSKEIPYAIKRYPVTDIKNSTTAYLYYGWKMYDPYGAAGACVMPDETTNNFFGAERALKHSDNYSGTNYIMTMMLHGFTLAQAKFLVDQGVDADYSEPTNTVFLLKTTDVNRNVRYKYFDNLDFDARSAQLDLPRAFKVLANTIPSSTTNVFGYQTGRSFVGDIKQHTYPPGTIADHLTSCGGFLLDAEDCGGGAQMSILSWVSNGVSASYGTVTEPCNFTQKFPDPRVYYWQRRGFNNGESYWMSVQNPFQGILIGDPLAAPFAQPPAVSFTNLTADQVVTGSIPIYVNATTNSLGTPSQTIELYLDDMLVSSIATGAPLPGNRLSLTLDGNTTNYTVATDDSLYDAVSGLASAVNSTSWDVDAHARGDRLSLVYTNFGQKGTGVSFSVFTETGTASTLRVWGEAVSSNLMEAIYPAREFLVLAGTADTGDVVACEITLTNGVTITNTIIATQGESSSSVLRRLRNAINTDTSLTNANGVIATNFISYSTAAEMSLDARSGGAWGYNLLVDYQITGTGLDSGYSFSDNFNDNREVLSAHGDAFFVCGSDPLAGHYLLDTTTRPNGPCVLTAVARLGNATEAAAWTSITVIVSNAPFSGQITYPTNNATIMLGESIVITAEWTNASGSITQTQWSVQGKQEIIQGNTNRFEIDSRDIGLGEITISACAWDSTGQAAETADSSLTVTMSPTIDTDDDGLADEWEQYWFGTIWLYTGANNPDEDPADNHHEYMADTDPIESTNYFQIDSINALDTTNNDVAISFLSSSQRVYQAQFTDMFATNQTIWSTGSTFFAGSGAVTNWTDDGSGTGSHPTNVNMRTYRIRVKVP